MRADLAKLLDLQSKDAAIADVDQRVEKVRWELAALDAALQRARTNVQDAQRIAAESAQRCNELEAKLESHRAAQERRRQRLDQVRTSKEATAAMAELELTGAVQAKEEGEWVRTAELVEQHQGKAHDLERDLAVAEAAQAPERERLGQQLRALEQEQAAAVREREASAEQVEPSLRLRYDRLRRTRTSAVVVPLVGATCGACFTSVPLNRRTQIRAGQTIDGCEACGAILYPPDSQ